MSTFRFRIIGPLTKFKDPAQKVGTIIKCLTAVNEIPPGVPLKPNPREQRGSKGIFRKVRDTLVNQPDLFHLVNGGLSIISTGCRTRDEYLYLEIEPGDGLFDGGGTYNTILDVLKLKQLPEGNQALAQLQVLVDVPKRTRAQISEGINTTNKVQQYTMATYRGDFKVIQKALGPYADRIIWREGDPGDMPVKTLATILAILDPEQPKVKINHWAVSPGRALTRLIKNPDGFQERMASICVDCLKLFDYLHLVLPASIKRKLRSAEVVRGKVQGFGYVEAKQTYLPFLETESEYRMDITSMYPILSGLSKLITTERDGKAQWRANSLDDVKAFVEALGRDIMDLIHLRYKEAGLSVPILSRDAILTENLQNRVERAANNKKL